MSLSGKAAEPQAGDKKEIKIKGVDYTFRWCPAGTFTMGSPESELENLDFTASVIARSNEEMEAHVEEIRKSEKQHKVTLSKGFWILETEVTQKMWKEVMNENPSEFKGDQLPVEEVSWDDCQKYIVELNRLGTAPKGFKFSLPTEAQWEYACRAGTTTMFNYSGNTLNGDKANCDGTKPYGTDTKGKFLKETSNVGSYDANIWGLYDMHGNVWEWCEDGYEDYPSDAVTDPNPNGKDSDSNRVLRGGSWDDYAWHCRSASRGHNAPSIKGNNVGLRLVLVNEN
ncbi:MAG: formylglycine-generating enzyme family protein [Prevotellaceae bacterium]|jgi:formylglycine-generating enzyme required for sulfatase activity|nr:formylglycine-generating enzyme family protein [Prevotellaceae bacterium]